MLESKAEKIAAFAAGLTCDAIPEQVLLRAKCHLLDNVGLAIFAARDQPHRDIVAAFAAADRNADSAVIASGVRLSPANAALLNGMAAHAYDCDDTHIGSTTHPSSVIVPVVLAVGESVNATGAEALAALIAGYEIVGRLGYPLPDVSAFHRGYQVTALYGVFGAAAAAAKLMGANADQITHAIGLAASQAGGLRQFSAAHEESEAKRFHSGWPAHSGIVAAQLAKAGLTAPRQALEGERGLYATLLGRRPSDPEALVRGLGSDWETLGLAPKAYCGVQGMQPMIAAALSLWRELQGRQRNIVSVHLELSAFAVGQLCEPSKEKRNPGTPHSAILAVPFCIALALVRGSVTPADLTEETLKDESIVGLANRTTHALFEPGIAVAAGGASVKGLITIQLANGDRLRREITNYRGDPDNPMSPDDYVEKFRTNTAALSQERQSQFIEQAMALEAGMVRDALSPVAEAANGAFPDNKSR